MRASVSHHAPPARAGIVLMQTRRSLASERTKRSFMPFLENTRDRRPRVAQRKGWHLMATL
ncbi:hypothetical protein ASPCADRAFT_210285, partial [Aspergillus carbonarius ITEM 5010]